MRRTIAAALACLLWLSLAPFSEASVGSVVPKPDEGVVSGATRGDSVDIGYLLGGGKPGVALVGSPASNTGPVTFARYVYTCLGNSYAVNPAVNIPCEASIQACTEGTIATRQYTRFEATVPGGSAAPPPGPLWTPAGISCITPTEAAEAQVVFTLQDFRRLPLSAATPAIQPAGGEALIRMRTNVYVDPGSTGQQTFDITLLGTAVQVRATPATYTWDFGDGSDPLVTEDPGAPYPDLTTWHEYTDPGSVSISLTTAYTGEYSVAGGPWVEIPGTAEVVSEPQPLQLLSTANRLTG